LATILVVDDDDGIRLVMKAILEQDGFTIVEAGDGESALEIALADPPDLIFLDLMMPGIDGIEVLKRLRADERTAKVDIVVVSARGAEGRPDAMAAGADDYFEKPFSPLALLQTVERRLGSA